MSRGNQLEDSCRSLARSAGWVCSRSPRTTQGLTALAPPKRGFIRLRQPQCGMKFLYAEASCHRLHPRFRDIPGPACKRSARSRHSFPSGCFPSRRPCQAHRLRSSSLSWVNTPTGWNETSRPRLVFHSQTANKGEIDRSGKLVVRSSGELVLTAAIGNRGPPRLPFVLKKPRSRAG